MYSKVLTLCFILVSTGCATYPRTGKIMPGVTQAEYEAPVAFPSRDYGEYLTAKMGEAQHIYAEATGNHTNNNIWNQLKAVKFQGIGTLISKAAYDPHHGNSACRGLFERDNKDYGGPVVYVRYPDSTVHELVHYLEYVVEGKMNTKHEGKVWDLVKQNKPERSQSWL